MTTSSAQLLVLAAFALLAMTVASSASDALRYNGGFTFKNIGNNQWCYPDLNSAGKPLRCDSLAPAAGLFSLTGNNSPFILNNSYITNGVSLNVILNAAGDTQWCLSTARAGYPEATSVFCNYGSNLPFFQMVKRKDVDPINDDWIWPGSYISFYNTQKAAFCGVESSIVTCNYTGSLSALPSSNATVYRVYF
jgi:hypothetical protein